MNSALFNQKKLRFVALFIQNNIYIHIIKNNNVKILSIKLSTKLNLYPILTTHFEEFCIQIFFANVNATKENEYIFLNYVWTAH